MHLYCNKQLETTFHQFCEKPLHITFNSNSSNISCCHVNVKLWLIVNLLWCSIQADLPDLVQAFIFSARCNIYISYFAKMSVSVWLSVHLSIYLWRLFIVVTVCNGSRISLHAWIDGCLCYLLTTPHPDRRMGCCQDFWWKRGGVWKNW